MSRSSQSHRWRREDCGHFTHSGFLQHASFDELVRDSAHVARPDDDWDDFSQSLAALPAKPVNRPKALRWVPKLFDIVAAAQGFALVLAAVVIINRRVRMFGIGRPVCRALEVDRHLRAYLICDDRP